MIDSEKNLREILKEFNTIYAKDIFQGGYPVIQEIEDAIEKFGLVKIHGQLLTDNQGNGILIMGEAGVGKSKLSHELMQRFPGFRFVADDFPIVSVRDGVMYGGYNPLLRNSHNTITYNPDLNNKAAEKVNFTIPKDRLEESFVLIKQVVFLKNDAQSTSATAEEMNSTILNKILNQSVSELSGKMLKPVSGNSVQSVMVRVPTEKSGRFDQIIEALS